MTTGITRENLMMLVQQAPDELCTLLNNSSQLLSSLAKIRKICKENDVSFPPKKEKKKNTKKGGSTKPMNAYNAFLQECKKNPAVTETVGFAERSAIQSKLWNEAKGKGTELYQKCVKLAAADKLEKEKEALVLDEKGSSSSSSTDDEKKAKKAKKVADDEEKAVKKAEKKAKEVSKKASKKKEKKVSKKVADEEPGLDDEEIESVSDEEKVKSELNHNSMDTPLTVAQLEVEMIDDLSDSDSDDY
jgi:hypothetical protein